MASNDIYDAGEEVEVRLNQNGLSSTYQPATVISFDGVSNQYKVTLRITGETVSVIPEDVRPLSLPSLFENVQISDHSVSGGVATLNFDLSLSGNDSDSGNDDEKEHLLHRSVSTPTTLPSVNVDVEPPTPPTPRSLSNHSSLNINDMNLNSNLMINSNLNLSPKERKVRFMKSKTTGYVPSSSSNRNRSNLDRDHLHNDRLPLFTPRLVRHRSSVFHQMVNEVYLRPKQMLPPNQYDVDDAIDHMGMGQVQWFLFAIIGLVSFAYAMEIVEIAFLLPILQTEFGVSPLETTLVPISSMIGSLIGATVLGKVSDHFGRRLPIIFGVGCTAVAGLASALSHGLIQEAVARFFSGFFMEIGVVALTLFAEFLPSTFRGKILILQSGFETLGMMASVGLAWVTLTFYDWRMYIKLSTIPLWIAVIGAFFMYESPRYLMTAGKAEETKALLTKISERNGVDLPEGELVEQANRENKEDEYAEEDIDWMNQMENEQWWFTTILLLLVYIIYQAGYYGVIFVSVRYFAKLDSIYHLHHEMYWEMILTTFSEIPGIVIGYFMIDYGRKRTISVSFAFYTLFTWSLVIIDAEFNRGIGVFLLCGARLWIAVAGMGAAVYFLEYYKTKQRATAFGFAVSMSMFTKMGAIVSAEVLHIMVGMYVFGALGNLAFVASLMLPNDHPDSWFLED